MINYAIVRNQETDKNVAVVAHDSSLGRVVFKVRNLGSAISRSLNLHYDRSLIVQEPELVNGLTIIKRRRSIPKDSDYLNVLLDKAVKIPYEVRHLKSIESRDKLDTFIEKLEQESM